MTNTSQSRKAFTLVELLAVIGMIALLISILLPALSRARAQAQTVKCMSNMRQLYVYMTMYSNESRDYFLPGNGIKNKVGSWRLVRYSGTHVLPGEIG